MRLRSVAYFYGIGNQGSSIAISEKIGSKMRFNENLSTKWYKVVNCGKNFDIFET